MTEPKTSEEKIEWLWRELNKMNEIKASLELALELAERRIEVAEQNAERARIEALQYADEVIRMAKEVNDARISAANAVKDHIAASEG